MPCTWSFALPLPSRPGLSLPRHVPPHTWSPCSAQGLSPSPAPSTALTPATSAAGEQPPEVQQGHMSHFPPSQPCLLRSSGSDTVLFLLVLKRRSEVGTGWVIDFCLSLAFGLRSGALYLAGLAVCSAAQAAGLLLSPFASPAIPNALKPPPGQGAGRARGSRRARWVTGAGNCPRVLLTSMKVAGLLCKARAVGIRGSRIGRCHLHDPGPRPPSGRGTNYPGWLLSGARRAEARLAAGPDITPCPMLCFMASSETRAHRTGMSPGPAVLLASWPRGTRGAALPRCCRPWPRPRRHGAARHGLPPPGLRGGSGPGQRVFPGA